MNAEPSPGPATPGGPAPVEDPAFAPAVFLAVDGGASKTDVWVVSSDGAVLGTARGPGSNHQFSGLDGAMDALETTVEAALTAAGRDPLARPAVATGVYCLAGVDLPIDEERLGAAIRTRGWSRADQVHNDSVAVLRAGVRSGWGVAVVCGSGLNCVGLGPDGTTERFPSLAELSGDFASGGSWLGVRALGTALRSRDGRGRPTVLARRVPDHFGLTAPEEVLTAVYSGTLDYGRLFELARICLDAAEEGDGPAGDAVRLLADEVVAMACAIIGRLGVGDQAVDVALGGGLFDGDHPGFVGRVEAGIRAVAPRARFQRADADPVLGAGLLGLDALGAPEAAGTRLRAEAALLGPASTRADDLAAP